MGRTFLERNLIIYLIFQRNILTFASSEYSDAQNSLGASLFQKSVWGKDLPLVSSFKVTLAFLTPLSEAWSPTILIWVPTERKTNTQCGVLVPWESQVLGWRKKYNAAMLSTWILTLAHIWLAGKNKNQYYKILPPHGLVFNNSGIVLLPAWSFRDILSIPSCLLFLVN